MRDVGCGNDEESVRQCEFRCTLVYSAVAEMQLQGVAGQTRTQLRAS